MSSKAHQVAIPSRKQSSVAPRSLREIRLDGGRSCLDFVNSIHDWHAAAREDYLATPQHYVAWCTRAGLLTANEARRIGIGSRSETLMRDVRRFREFLYALLCSRIDDEDVPEAASRELNRWLHGAWRALELDVNAPGRLRWHPRALDARLPLKRVALSALEVLRAGASGRLKRCATPHACGWLFYDESKSNGRLWCSMQTCGAASKMKRYRARSRSRSLLAAALGRGKVARGAAIRGR